mgnify:CR=1 FL=1
MSEERIKQVHFIGVGGVGMSGIARVAHDQGMQVSGSDIKESRYTKQLREAGITVFIGQKAENIPEGNPVIVISTAILENNPELIEARRRGLEIWHRAQMLAHLGVGLDTLAVAGTHGKTTTSSMLASALDALGADPTFLIGGIVRAYGTNAHSGGGRYYVVEADESDKSFTYLSPAAAIVTNIEADHLDHYEGLEEIYAQFAAFLSGVREGGPIVVCGDDPKLVEVARGTGRAVTTYGFSEDCDARILATEAQGVGTRFTLRLPDGRVVASRIKQNPGLHNVSNGAAVLTLISLLGLDVDLAAEKLQEFAGVRRRFDLIGEAGGVTVVDDYAHHPRELAATLTSVRKMFPGRRITALFQPHLYTRTRDLHAEFAEALSHADEVVLLPIYPAREEPIPGITSEIIARRVAAPCRIVDRDHLADEVAAMDTDVVISFGAGNIDACCPALAERLKMKS